MFAKQTKTLFFLLSLVLLASTSAFANLVALSFTDTNGEDVTVDPSKRYINPDSAINLYLSAGLERKVKFILRDSSGSIVEEDVSSTISDSDSLTSNGQTFYGKVLTISAGLPEGDYTLTAQILSNEDEVLFSQEFPITVDRSPPKIGDLYWVSWPYSGSILRDTPPIVSRMHGRIKITGLTDESSIESVSFESYNPENGDIYYRTAAWVNVDAHEAGVGTSSSYIPEIAPHDGLLGVRFIVYDKAGNVKKIESLVKYDHRSPLASPELIAVYNPNISTEFIPGVSATRGFESYTPGMTVYANPITLLYRIPRYATSVDNPDYGLSPVGGSEIYADNDYRYYTFSFPYSLSGHMENNHRRFRTPGWWGAFYIFYNLVLSDTAPKSPEVQSYQLYYSDIGWASDYRSWINSPITITKAKVIVEPRNYDQFFRGIGSGCTIPAGQTECIVDDVYVAPSLGTIYYLHNGLSVRNADGSLFAEPHWINVYFDLQPPSIVSFNLDRRNKKIIVHATEPNTGAHWGHVALNSGWLIARNVNTGEEIRVDQVSLVRLGGNDSDITIDYSSLPEGNWDFTIWIKDNYSNTDSQDIGNVVLDNTAPQINIFNNSDILNSGDAISSLGNVRITLSDNVDTTPEILDIRLTGGPEDVDVNLASREVDGSYVLEYPVLLPTLEDGEEYTLIVRAKDDQNNISTKTVVFSYSPPQINLAGVGAGTINVPVIPANVVHSDGKNIIYSEPIELFEGQVIAGTYNLIVKLFPDSTTSAVVNGIEIQPGEQTLIPDYNFGNHDGRLDIPIRANTPGRVRLMITSPAPNFPVLSATFNFWLPEVSLVSYPDNQVQPIIETNRVTALKSESTPCQIVSSESDAQNADPVNDPKCLIEWTSRPQYYRVSENFIEGTLAPEDNTNVAYKLYIYNNGQRYLIGEGNKEIEVSEIEDIRLGVEKSPDRAEYFRKVQPVEFTLRHSGVFRDCPLVWRSEEADRLGQEKIVCLVHWDAIPEGIEPYYEPGQSESSTLTLNGRFQNEGNQTLRMTIDIYSPIGRLANAVTQEFTFTSVNPPLPEISIAPNMYSEKVTDTLYATSNLLGGEVGKLKFSAPDANIALTLEMDNVQEGHVSYQYPPASSVVEYTRYFNIGNLSIWEKKPVTIKVYYTDFPEIANELNLDILGVPSQKIKVSLSMASQQEAYLDTDDIELKARVGLKTVDSDCFYDPEKIGIWQIRFGYLDADKNFVPLTDFKNVNTEGVVNDTVNLNIGKYKLYAQASIVPPEFASGYSRLILSYPLRVTVLKGLAPEGNLVSKQLYGEAPFKTILTFNPDDDSKPVLGTVKWMLSSNNGTTWETLAEGRRFELHLDVGHYLVKAEVTNRYSDKKQFTDTLEIIVFNVPKLAISGPRKVLINTPVTLTAEALVNEQVVPADIRWYRFDENRKLVQVAAGPEYSFTETTATSAKIYVKAKTPDAPDVKKAWETVVYRVGFSEPKPLNGRIYGPTYMEFNTVEPQVYTLNATVTSEVDKSLYTVRDKWVLPNGEVVPDVTTITYSPSQADFEAGRIVFEHHIWIDGYDDTLRIVKKKVKIGRYSWPKFDLSWSAKYKAAPSLVRLSVNPVDYDGKLKDPEYTWHLPASAEVVRDYGKTIYAKFNKPGQFDVSVDIVDARGSTAHVTNVVTLSEPEPFELTLLPSYSNDFYRTPLDVKVRVKWNGGHPLDDINSFGFFVDDPNATIEAYSTFARIKGLSEGHHVITVNATSELGVPVMATLPVDVNPNVPPVCKIEQTDYDNYIKFSADCSDEDGKVERYEWILNDEVVSTLKRKVFNKPIKGHIVFRAFDDSGDCYEQEFFLESDSTQE